MNQCYGVSTPQYPLVLVKFYEKLTFEPPFYKLKYIIIIIQLLQLSTMPVKKAFRKSPMKNPKSSKTAFKKSMSAKTVHMPLKALIKEHEKLIHVLKNGTEKELKKELKDQTKELLKYKKYK